MFLFEIFRLNAKENNFSLFHKRSVTCEWGGGIEKKTPALWTARQSIFLDFFFKSLICLFLFFYSFIWIKGAGNMLLKDWNDFILIKFNLVLWNTSSTKTHYFLSFSMLRKLNWACNEPVRICNFNQVSFILCPNLMNWSRVSNPPKTGFNWAPA